MVRQARLPGLPAEDGRLWPGGKRAGWTGIAATAQPCAAGNGPDRTGSRTRGHRACEQCPPSVRSKRREKRSPTIARKMAADLGVDVAQLNAAHDAAVGETP